MTLFVQLVPGNAKTTSECRASKTSRRGRKNRFSLKNEACQAPHRCYKSAPAYMSCADNIPTVCAPWPLFSLRRGLVGLQLKQRPPIFFLSPPPFLYFLASHPHRYHFSHWSNFSPSHPRQQRMSHNLRVLFFQIHFAPILFFLSSPLTVICL